MAAVEHDVHLSFRLPAAIVARLDRLAERLQAGDLGALGTVKRSAAARVALLRGLDALEAEARPARRAGRRPRR